VPPLLALLRAAHAAKAELSANFYILYMLREGNQKEKSSMRERRAMLLYIVYDVAEVRWKKRAHTRTLALRAGGSIFKK